MCQKVKNLLEFSSFNMFHDFNFSIDRAGGKVILFLISEPMESCASLIDCSNVKNDVFDRVDVKDVAWKQADHAFIRICGMKGNTSDAVLKFVSADSFKSFRSFSQVVKMNLTSKVTDSYHCRVRVPINSATSKVKNLLFEAFSSLSQKEIIKLIIE